MCATKTAIRALALPATYLPELPIRPLSPQSLLKAYPGEQAIVTHNSLLLTGKEGDVTRGPVQAYMDAVTNLPTTMIWNYSAMSHAVSGYTATVSEVAKANYNLSASEKELLKCYRRLGHLSFKKVQFLMRQGVLASTAGLRRLHDAASRLQTLPKCATLSPCPAADELCCERRGRILQG